MEVLYFIVNPSSKSGKGRSIWRGIEKELKLLHRDYHVYFTDMDHSGEYYAQLACEEDKPRIIVAIGGDGTVNEVINGITDFDKTKFAYIPTGSSNDFARALGIPTKTSKCLNAVLYSKNYKEIDIGQVSFPKYPTKRFGVSTGMGYDASICHEALKSRIKDVLNFLHLGSLTYVAIAIKQIFLYKMNSITIKIDDKDVHEYNKVLFITVMNQKYEGGGCNFCPYAVPDDELLDVCVINGLPKIVFFPILPFTHWGWHRFLPGVELYKCKKVELISDRPLPIHADGESCDFQKEMTVSLVPKKLKLIMP